MNKEDKKSYSLRVIPELKSVQKKDADGNPIDGATEKKATYIRRSKADADNDITSDRFVHLQLTEKGETLLAGDTKPYTLTVFAGANPVLFDNLEMLITGDDFKTKRNILPTESKVMVLDEPLPGLVRRKKCKKHKATYTNKAGNIAILKANKKQPDGSYQKEEVILDFVQYFLFDNQVNEDDDELQYIRAVGRLLKPIGGDTEEVVAKATAEVKTDEGTGEEPE